MAGLDFKSMCRLCVKFFDKEKGSPIFNNDTYNDKISLPERIKYCSAVEVAEDDGLPPKICNTCLFKLNQSFVFRNQCVLADITLKRLKDISFSVSEIPNLLKVDVDNQIIQLEKYDICNVDLEKSKANFKDDDKIDEFDNSKNGRHKRIIHKLKTIPLKKTKILISKTEDLQKYVATDGTEKNAEKSPLIIDSEIAKEKIKNNSEKEISTDEDLTKAKKFKKLKAVKELKTDKIIESNLAEESEIKHFTINPNLNSFSSNEGGLSADSNPKEVIRDCSTEVSNAKLMKFKKDKKIKMTYCKKKPSSFKCDYCQKVYPSEGGWRYHIHTMHNENYQPFICDLCGQAFKVKKNLVAHKNSIHFHLKLHLCDLCGRGFASKYALKVHKIWHNDEKNFSCDVCGTKFRTRGKMNTHRSIHGGPKKFMCHICSRDFRWKKDFEIHMRTHTGEKPFKCSHCGKAFASVTNMKKHEKNHLKKLESDEISEKEEVAALPTETKLRQNEVLVFCYEVDNDLKNNQINQLTGTTS